MTFIQHNRALLRPDQDAKIHNEIDWGTSTKPPNIALRQQLQSNPFFLTLLGLPLTRSQRADLDRNPQLKAQVMGQHLAVKIRPSRRDSSANPTRSNCAAVTGLTLQRTGQKPPNRSPNARNVGSIGISSPFSNPPDSTPGWFNRLWGSIRMHRVNMCLSLAGSMADIPAREVPLPIIPAIRVELDELSHKAAQLTAVEHNISRSQARLQRNACVHPLLTKESIRLDNNRRANLKRDIDKRAAKLLYTAGIAYGARVLALEDLSSLRTEGKKGQLAKIVTVMVKRQGPIVAKIRSWAAAIGQPLSIKLVDPHNTSKIHFVSGGSCLGKIHRTREIGICSVCGHQVGVHHNAALNIAQRA